ncbi:LAMI_0C08834g1_1 [Lachancea mirantina]|uniref:LAMI_0C08834g1_1 n=1 Tax=Lachancea mirantina TaxID=1230905 RepID=A0A1G4J5H5_9SACH|nr:LAMI_0C08834g1_1 [Lachancea mirantina]
MTSQTPKVVYGAYPLATLSQEDRDAVYKILDKHNIAELDTARIYPGSEEALGKQDAGKKYKIDTKAAGFSENSNNDAGIRKSIKESLELLKLDKVYIYYLHSPDPSTPLEETLATINELYKAGKFEKFGISNYTASDVRKIYEIAKKNGYPLPSVYQGNYNAFARKIEDDLFPVLRELNITFYAYSPIAGGFLARSRQQIEEAAEGGRFDPSSFIGQMYRQLYAKPSLLKALEEWEQIAESEGISKVSLAYRWVAYHSELSGKYGDAFILGARTPQQLEQTLEALAEGPLSAEAAKKVRSLWELIKDEAPIDNYVVSAELKK